MAKRQPRLTEVGEEGLKVVLKRIYSMVGLRAQHFPVAGDKQLLHRFILKHYAQHTPQEIELAFEMAISGQLEIRPDEVRVVDQFTVAHFGRVMAAYRNWAAEVARRQAYKEPPPEPPKPTPLQLKLLDLDYACARAWMHQHGLKLPLSKIPR